MVTVIPEKIVMENKRAKAEDILDIIKKSLFKERKKEPDNDLKPTMANLFGLESRFRKQDKEM